MGTWAAPDTAAKKQLRRILKDLNKLEAELWNVFGDDLVADDFMEISERINWALKGKWEKKS
jgi:hypothetical protein